MKKSRKEVNITVYTKDSTLYLPLKMLNNPEINWGIIDSPNLVILASKQDVIFTADENDYNFSIEEIQSLNIIDIVAFMADSYSFYNYDKNLYDVKLINVIL